MSMSNVFSDSVGSKGGAFVVGLPPTNVTWAQITASKPYVG